MNLPERKQLRRRAGGTLRAALDRLRRRLPPQRIVVDGQTMHVPRGHPLLVYAPLQPRRNGALREIAHAFEQAEPGVSFLDIGANIGDTAAILGAAAPSCPMILVEPSAEYRAMLRGNTSGLNIRRIESSFISSGPVIDGRLVLGNGTARVQRGAGRQLPSKTLSQVADDDTRFVKLDTDGFDHEILTASIDWLRLHGPAIYYEDEVTTPEDLSQAGRLANRLCDAGYERYAVWDDAGYPIAIGCSVEMLHSLQRWLHLRRCGLRQPGIYNFDVLAVTVEDLWLFKALATK